MRTSRVVVLKTAVDVLVRVAALALFPLTARTVGAAGYGAYTQLLTLVVFLVPFAGLGMGGAMVATFAGRSAARQELRRILLAVLLVSGALGAATTLAAPWLAASLLDDPRGTALFRWSWLLLVAGAVEYVALEYLRARETYRWYLSTQALSAVLGVLVFGALLLATDDLVRAVAALAATRGATAAVLVVAALRDADTDDPHQRQRGGAASIVALARFGLPLTVASLGVWLMNAGDRLVIGNVLPAADLGRYSAVYTLAGLTSLATGALFLPAYTRIARAVSSSLEVGPEIRLFHGYVAVILPPVAVILALLIPDLLLLLGGSEFHVPVMLAAVLVAGLVLDQWNGLAHYVLVVHGRTLLLQNLWLACGLVNLVANVVVVPRFGLLGAAVVTLVTFASLEVAVFAAATQHVSLRRYYAWSRTLTAVACSSLAAAAAVVVQSVLPPGVVSAALGVFVFVTTFAVAAVQRGLVGWDELMRFRELLPRKEMHDDPERS